VRCPLVSQHVINLLVRDPARSGRGSCELRPRPRRHGVPARERDPDAARRLAVDVRRAGYRRPAHDGRGGRRPVSYSPGTIRTGPGCWSGRRYDGRTRPEPVFTPPGSPADGRVLDHVGKRTSPSNALGTGLLLNHYDLLGRNGVSRELAVTLFTPLALAQLGVVLLAGLLVDRFQPHRVLALPMCAMATACLLARAGGLGPWPFIYAGTLGIALGSFQAANVAAWAHYFGRAHLGEIRGLTFVITIVGAALGPLPFGWAAERGGYGPVLLAGAVGCVAVALVNIVTPVAPRTPTVENLPVPPAL